MPDLVSLSRRLKYYKREDVRKSLVEHAANKEVAVRFGEQFGKRPDILRYPSDVLEFVKKGATSFHCSEELWRDPLAIATGASKNDLSENRIGWDLVLDIDCPVLDFSAKGASLLLKALEHYDVSRVDIKFSGNHGFHIGVPFRAFPAAVNDVNIKDWFPDGPRKIASLLQRLVRPHLELSLLEECTPQEISERVKLPLETVWRGDSLNVSSFLKVDTVLIAPRHLYRMPYSMNEKSGLVSIPIHRESLDSFDSSIARTENVVVDGSFLLEQKNAPGEARRLFIEALDEHVEDVIPVLSSSKNFGTSREKITVTEAVREELFPPCIKLTLQGLVDGKKRALFTLLNFLRSVGWSKESVVPFVNSWNAKNTPPLPQTVVDGQVHYSFSRKEVLPPNCSNEGYYLSYGVCKPDSFCRKIKNPANYTLLKWKMSRLELVKKRRDVPLSEEEKGGNQQEPSNSNL